jgi:hypothetical protein
MLRAPGREVIALVEVDGMAPAVTTPHRQLDALPTIPETCRPARTRPLPLGREAVVVPREARFRPF